MSDSRELAIFVFIDALGWEIFSRQHWLNDLWAVTAPQETVLGYSCTCDPTILTGCMPEEHGHFSFFLKATEQSPFRTLGWLRFLPGSLCDRGRVRRLLSRSVAKLNGFTGYFQLYETPFEYLPYFDYSEKRDIYQPGGILGGQPTIFDELRAQQIPFHLSDWRQSESTNFDDLQRALREGETQFAYLYLAGLDGIMHSEGPDSPRVSEHLQWYEKKLREVVAFAEQQYDQVRVHVFSDHGMTRVTRHLDLMKTLAGLPFEFGKDYLAYLDSTMARFWFSSDRVATEIRRVLSTVAGGRGLSDEELSDYGVFFSDRRYGEYIFLCDPGVLICPSFMGKKPLAGMHGYAPEHPDSAATFASSASDCPVPQRLDQMIDVMRWEASRLSQESCAPVATGVAS